MVDSDNVINEVYEGRYNSSTNPYGNEYEITELEIVEAGPKVNATISSPSRTVKYMPTSFSITYTNTGIDPAEDMPYVVVFQHANGTNQTIDSDFIWDLPVGGTTTKNYQIVPTELGPSNITVYYNYTFNTITTQKSNVRSIFVGLPEIAIRSEDISFSDDFVKPGETVNVTTFIRNLGPYTAYNITSILFVNESETDDWLTTLISNGGYSIVRFNFTVTFPDHHLIQVSANDDMRQYEVNQGDNIASKVMVYVYDDSLGNIGPQIEFENLDNGYISGTVPLTSKVIDPDTDTSVFKVDFNITNSTDDNYLFTVEEPIPGMSVQSGTGAFFGSDFDSLEYADGDYIFTVYTTDGIEPNSSSSYPYIIDNTKPIVNIIAPESESLIEGIVEINYTIVESNPRFAKYRYSNNGGTSWSSYSNLPGPVDYNGGINSFGFDSSLCPDLKEPNCIIEVWCQDYAENVGNDTDNYKTNETKKTDDDDNEKTNIFDIDYELVCVPNEFTLHVDSKITNVGGAYVSILTPSNKLIKGRVTTGRQFTTYLEEAGVYTFEVSKFDFETYKGTFVLLDCDEEIDEDKNILMEVDFNCPGNILSVMLRNSTGPLPEQKVQYYLGDLVYNSETDYNGYTSIAVNDIGTYTIFVSSETYNMLMEDYTVSELCPVEEIIDEEDKDDDKDTEDEDKEPDELPYEQIEDSLRSLLDRTLQFISPQLKIKSGCDGFYYEGLPLILCDLVWFIVLIESVLVGYIQFNNRRKYLLVILFAAPILMAIIFAPIYGAVLGALELGTSIYFYYRKKAREKYQYKKLEEELMR